MKKFIALTLVTLGITVSGTDFMAGATVTVGGAAATGVTVTDATVLTATNPAHAAGAVGVTVTNPGALSASLAGAFTYNPLRYHAVTPCRAFDTRQADGPAGGPAFTPGGIRQFSVGGVCSVPAGARAVVVNLTAVNPAGVGNLRVAPSGVPVPTAEWGVMISEGRNYISTHSRANNASVSLGADGKVQVRCDMTGAPTGTVHVLMDVYGYYN